MSGQIKDSAIISPVVSEASPKRMEKESALLVYLLACLA